MPGGWLVVLPSTVSPTAPSLGTGFFISDRRIRGGLFVWNHFFAPPASRESPAIRPESLALCETGRYPAGLWGCSRGHSRWMGEAVEGKCFQTVSFPQCHRVFSVIQCFSASSVVPRFSVTGLTRAGLHSGEAGNGAARDRGPAPARSGGVRGRPGRGPVPRRLRPGRACRHGRVSCLFACRCRRAGAFRPS